MILQPIDLVSDGLAAYSIGKDAFGIVTDFISKIRATGVDLAYPEMRVNLRESRLEFGSGLSLRKKFFGNSSVKLEIPIPTRLEMWSLKPVYAPVKNPYFIKNDKIFLDSKNLEASGEEFRIQIEYPVENPEVLNGLVSSSAPRDTINGERSGDSKESFWLHAELKSLKLLKDLYSAVRIEDVNVMVEIAIKEHIRELFSDDIKLEMMMNAKFNSPDRNERAKAIFYRQHHVPKFKGNINKVTNDISELLQPSRFRNYLSLSGSFRFDSCRKGVTLANALEPIYLPNYMDIFSTTDLTLDEPGKDGKLIYDKSRFVKRVRRTIFESKQFKEGF